MRYLLATALAVMFSLASFTARAQVPTITVAYNTWVGHAGVFVAQEKGLFEKNGIKVELKSFAGPGDVVQPLGTGGADIGLTTADTVLINNAGEDVKLVIVGLIDASTGADAMVVKPEITSLKDLKGKKVAATVGQCNHLLLLKALATVGLDEGDIELASMDGDAAGTAFISGALDAAVTWEPWVSQITSSGQGRVAYSTKDAPDVIFDVIAVTDAYARAHPKEIAAFLKGVSDGLAYLEAHPEESHKIVAGALSASADDVKAMLGGVTLYDLAENARLLGTPDSHGPVQKSLEEIAEFQVDHDVYETKPDVAASIDPTAVVEASR